MELKWTKLLKKIGFSEIEAKIYECLVYKPGLNPTQLSKILEISRSAAYTSVSTLESKGFLLLIPANDDSKNYNSESPNKILEKLKIEYMDIFEQLDISFKEFNKNSKNISMYEISGKDNILSYIFKILKGENTYVLGEVIEEYKNYVDNIEKIYSEEDMTLVNEKEVLIITNDIAYYTQNKYIVKNIYKRIELEKRIK